MKELQPIEETWNKKRVILGLIISGIIVASLVGFKAFVLDKNQNISQDIAAGNIKAVQGATAEINSLTQVNPAASLKNNIQEQINTIKQEAASINLTDIATSSPQVQKVLEDIKSIQDLPRSQAKIFCEQVCSSL